VANDSFKVVKVIFKGVLGPRVNKFMFGLLEDGICGVALARKYYLMIF